MPRTVGELRGPAREDALRRRVSPRDVDLLLADAIGRNVVFLIGHEDATVDEAAAARFEERIARRFAGEPLQYIRGRTEFYGREFVVDTRVLIPRPETEILVETALDRIPRGARVADIGTGTGCIAVTLAAERRDLRVVAVDRSVAALAVARQNRDAHGVRVPLAASDLHQSLRGELGAIVSNPPYVSGEEMTALDREVSAHEPHLALTPGTSGLELIERLIAGSKERLAEGGLLIMEIGWKQEEAVRELAAGHGWEVDAVVPDLAGIPRVVVLRAMSGEASASADRPASSG